MHDNCEQFRRIQSDKIENITCKIRTELTKKSAKSRRCWCYWGRLQGGGQINITSALEYWRHTYFLCAHVLPPGLKGSLVFYKVVQTPFQLQEDKINVTMCHQFWWYFFLWSWAVMLARSQYTVWWRVYCYLEWCINKYDKRHPSLLFFVFLNMKRCIWHKWQI